MSFSQALSGLNAAARNLDVIGNNIANVNTVGAKSSRVEFQDMYAASVGEGGGAVGSGVNANVVAQNFAQGSLRTTGNETDLAINGQGFFQLSDGSNPTVYSRNGQFKVDAAGYIVNNQQLKLLGYQAGPNGSIVPGAAIPIQISSAALPPVASSKMTLEFNADSRATRPSGLGAIAVPPLPAADEIIDTQDPSSYNNATSSTVYDVKGQPVTLTTYFQKVTNDTWNVYVTANGQSINGVAGEDSSAMRPVATLHYPASGAGLTAAAAGTIDAYAWSAAGVATTTPITDGLVTLATIPAVSLGSGTLSEPLTGLQLKLGSSTQYGSGFVLSQLAVDGSAPGSMTGFGLDSEGVVSCRYSNGQTKTVAMIELADFRNPQGLQPMGSNVWAQTRTSGMAMTNTPGSGALGLLQSGALEDSNVDLTAELVSMMTAQRAYQANAQTIKTQDQVMSTLVNLR